MTDKLSSSGDVRVAVSEQCDARHAPVGPLTSATERRRHMTSSAEHLSKQTTADRSVRWRTSLPGDHSGRPFVPRPESQAVGTYGKRMSGKKSRNVLPSAVVQRSTVRSVLWSDNGDSMYCRITERDYRILTGTADGRSDQADRSEGPDNKSAAVDLALCGFCSRGLRSESEHGHGCRSRSRGTDKQLARKHGIRTSVDHDRVTVCCTPALPVGRPDGQMFIAGNNVMTSLISLPIFMAAPGVSDTTKRERVA